MNLNTLKPAEGSTKTRKRIARGEGSGKGGTATRGHKGAKSRSGYSRKVGFEGGQMPIQRRLPKKGFKNISRIEYTVINLDRLQEMADKHKLSSLDIDTLRNLMSIGKDVKIKILGRGELKAKLDIKVDAFSESAQKAIEKAGGKIEKA